MIDLSPTGLPPKTHNNPPTPMEVCASDHDAAISEAQNWGDGETVDSVAQMDAVDAIIKDLKTYRSALKLAVEDYRRPFMDANTAAMATAKVYTDDADLLQKTLVAVVAPFKAKLEAERQAERQAAWEAARQAEREAEALAAKANAANIEEAREIAAAKQAAMDSKNAASAAQKNNVKGMRKVTKHEVCDMRALVNFIAANHKDEMAEFATEFARQNHSNIPDAIVRTWVEKEAF
jgi:hypothetical protein